jgi:hypothetical protein
MRKVVLKNKNWPEAVTDHKRRTAITPRAPGLRLARLPSPPIRHFQSESRLRNPEPYPELYFLQEGGTWAISALILQISSTINGFFLSDALVISFSSCALQCSLRPPPPVSARAVS